MQFQLWRRISTRSADKTVTLGTYTKVGQVTTRGAKAWVVKLSKHDTDQWVGLDLEIGDRVPVVPGDLLVSSSIGKQYRVVEVALNVSRLANSRPGWAVRARQLQGFEKFAKHRDYQQCTTRKKPTRHANPSA
jgi:hypothetical protein